MSERLFRRRRSRSSQGRHPSRPIGPTTSPPPGTPKRWPERRWLALTIRVVVFVVPLVVSFLAAVALSRWLPDFEPFWQRVVRWIAIAIVATIVLMATESVLRRLLPLAALLSLTLVFPDETPSRFGIALRGMSARQLAKRLDEVEKRGLGETPPEAAKTLLSLVGALSRHDRLTRGHSERVRAYSQLIGEEMELDEEQLDGLRWAGLLHDVGKMAVPPEILNKSGKLTDEEFAVIKTHPAHGKAMVAPLADWLGDSSRAVYEHHERWTGGGYPTGISGEHLALESRIVSVADAFDVMTSARSYKKAISLSEARAELQRCAGSQFDPTVVRAMMNVSLGRLWRAMGPLSWAAQIGLFPRPLASAAPAASSAAAAIVAALLTTISAVIPGGSTDGESTDAIDVVVVSTTTTTTTIVGFGDGTPGEEPEPARDGDEPAVTTTIASESAVPVGATTTVPPTTSTTTTTSTTIVATTSTVVATPTVPPPTPAPTTSPPPPTTVPATTVPATTVPTTTTTVPPTTTTTVPPLTTLTLSSPSPGDQESQPVLDLVAGSEPQNPGPVPNYDTDRNDDPGLTLRATPLGLSSTDPEGVQVWRLPASIAELQDAIGLEIWIAAADPSGPGQLIVRTGLFDCDADRGTCERLAQDTVAAPTGDGTFQPLTFDLTIPSTVLEPGHRFEIRLAPISGSASDVWVAYDSADTPSALTIDP